MSRYTAGDVILVPFPHEEATAKVRPVIVIATQQNGDLACCPIRSAPRTGSACIPITIDDFDEGGLDLFSKSYVQTDTVRTVRNGAVVAKKGRVTQQYRAMVESHIRR
jgi:mRNA-degrading endonuclease toxin of MazEF toxin-antitoxin module